MNKASYADRSLQAWLERARELDAAIVVSAVTVAELLRGVDRDAGINRVLKVTDVRPADETLARRAGRLLGRAAFDTTIDALVAATALTVRDCHGATRCVVLSSDPDDLTALLSEEPGILVIPV
ncbi:MAG: PIN domain-containing protein [Acidimicrobiales bacterium]